MIEYVTRKQLNVSKYDEAISIAINTRVYAYSWYLDVVCEQWDALVYNDYQAVMPIPRRKKFGINYIYLPPWTQQLGIFSSKKITQKLIAQFIGSIPRKFKLIDVFFNSENPIKLSKIEQRQNFILSLTKNYKDIRKDFSKGRKSSCKKGQNNDLKVVLDIDPDKIIELYKKNKGTKLRTKEFDLALLKKLITIALPLNFVQSLGVVDDHSQLLGGAFFLNDGHRITYLFSALNDEGREKQAMSFLIDHVIRTNAESDLIFDFEGSIIRELASFFKSFGAQKESYFHLRKVHLI